MRTNLQRFREDVDQRLRVLEAAVLEAEKGTSPEAAESVRRIARSIGHSAGDLGLVEIRRLAEDVVTTPDPARLVACARALLAEATRQPLPPGAAVVRILAVEDDPVMARLLQSMIGGEGREVVVVDTAAEAQRLVEERSFDLLLLDLVLPDAGGRDFLVTLRHRSDTADLPVIVCSALPAVRAEPECLALGLGEIVGVFVDDSRKLLARIRKGSMSWDARELERAAHQLKGSASNFQARRVMDLAAGLEAAGREGDVARASQAVPDLARALTELTDALESWVEQGAPEGT